MDLSFLKDKRVNIVGLGKTGLATASFFQNRGFDVRVWDDNAEKRTEALEAGYNVDPLDELEPKKDIVVWSPGIPHTGTKANPLALKIKSKGIDLIADMDVFCHALPHQDIIAITGTNGKSTTTALIHHALSMFKSCAMGGNIGTAVLSMDELPNDGTYVLECSSYQLELTPHLSPVTAILLNITPDHLERHNGFEGYIAAKELIFKNPRNDGAPRIAIIGQDTEPCRTMSEKLISENEWRVIPISTEKKQPNGVWVNPDTGIMYDSEREIANLNDHPVLKGAHNFENIAACYAALKYTYGYEAAAIWRAILSFKGLPHRQFKVASWRNIDFINDSKATNADAAEKALKSYKNIYWIAGGQPKETGLIGLESYISNIKHTALIGDATDDFALFLDQLNAPYTKSKTLDRAIHGLFTLARNDASPAVILLSPACASWDQFKSFEHRGDVFEKIVKELIDTNSNPQNQKAVS